jgi:hypothetical protein
MMEPKAKALRDLAERTRQESERAEKNLRQYEQDCSHNFTEPIYDPIYHKAYTIPGDPPGTMGVDWRGPCHVPAETIDRWRRECQKCGLVECTQEVDEQKIIKKVPKWRQR